MKSTGIVRKMDNLGRIVIPIELRRTLEIAERDPVEIYVEDDRIKNGEIDYETLRAYSGNRSARTSARAAWSS